MKPSPWPPPNRQTTVIDGDTFQVTLRGYASDNPDTDDLIKWVVADDQAAVEQYCADAGWDVVCVEVIRSGVQLRREDGVDVTLIPASEP
jgi:hypothetical protein